MILIAKEYGLQAVYGSMLDGGVVGVALGVTVRAGDAVLPAAGHR